MRCLAGMPAGPFSAPSPLATGPPPDARRRVRTRPARRKALRNIPRTHPKLRGNLPGALLDGNRSRPHRSPHEAFLSLTGPAFRPHLQTQATMVAGGRLQISDSLADLFAQPAPQDHAALARLPRQAAAHPWAPPERRKGNPHTARCENPGQRTHRRIRTAVRLPRCPIRRCHPVPMSPFVVICSGVAGSCHDTAVRPTLGKARSPARKLILADQPFGSRLAQGKVCNGAESEGNSVE